MPRFGSRRRSDDRAYRGVVAQGSDLGPDALAAEAMCLRWKSLASHLTEAGYNRVRFVHLFFGAGIKTLLREV